MRVLVVDDQVLFREGLVGLIGTQPDFVVVGEAGDGEEAVLRTRELRPDLVLMDIQMPKMSGLEATRMIRRDIPDARIVILTVSDDDDNLFEAIKAGAIGYLLKNLRSKLLFDRLRGVFRGEAALSPILATRVLEEFARHRKREAASSELPGLTDREKTVLQQVINGSSNKEIAASLAIAESTVKRHLHNILEKLHLENRVQAAAYAVRRGLIDGPREGPRSG